jgi:hypothetical protein
VISGKFWPRLATFVVGLSAFYTLIFLLPHLHHLAFNLLATAAALAGGLELSALLAHKGLPRARAAAWLGPLLPAAAYLELSGWRYWSYPAERWRPRSGPAARRTSSLCSREQPVPCCWSFIPGCSWPSWSA